MTEIIRILRRVGVLPISQGIVLTISTLTFAWLARQLGPENYARFAVILLIFSAASLVTDLSPQGFVLVQGAKSGILKAARRVATVSAIGGSILLSLALFAARSAVPLTPPSLFEGTILCLTLAAQSFTQVPRATLVISGRYKSMAATDILGTVLGCVAAVVISRTNYSEQALVAQLSLTVFIKLMLTILLTTRGQIDSSSHPSLTGIREALKFGFRVIPLNLASYLSRALDSGILPSLVSPSAAAGYARSYQVVVVPISQLQLSLGSVVVEKFSRVKRDDKDRSVAASLKLWTWLQRLSILSGIVIILCSSLIQYLLFGPRWPLVNVTLSAMATCLPGVAAAAFGAWSTQIDGGRTRTFLHFLAVLATPVAVVMIAANFNFTIALATLVVVGGLVQPIMLVLVHRQSIANSVKRIILFQVLQWILVGGLFLWVATSSGFWHANL